MQIAKEVSKENIDKYGEEFFLKASLKTLIDESDINKLKEVFKVKIEENEKSKIIKVGYK